MYVGVAEPAEWGECVRGCSVCVCVCVCIRCRRPRGGVAN